MITMQFYYRNPLPCSPFQQKAPFFAQQSNDPVDHFFKTLYRPHVKPCLSEIHQCKLKRQLQEVRIQSTEGTNLYGWFLPPQSGKPTVLFLPGVGSTLKSQLILFQWFRELGYGVLSYNYRGYGASTGNASEKGFYDDAKAASRCLSDLGIPPSSQVLWGRSIGTALAAYLASQQHFRAVILQSALTSLEDHLKCLSTDNPRAHYEADDFEGVFDSAKRIKQIHSPLLLLHGSDDPENPAHMPRTLFLHAKGSPKRRMVLIPESKHHLKLAQIQPAVEGFLSELAPIDYFA